MAISWFITIYKTEDRPDEFSRPVRYCAMNDYNALIFGDGGHWRETEVANNYALIKVRASDTTLATIAADPDIQRIPLSLLTEPLSTLTQGQRNTIQTYLEAMGYSTAEIRGALGNNIGLRTLGEVLRFAASRRFAPRWDGVQRQYFFDGPQYVPELVDDVDAEVQP